MNSHSYLFLNVRPESCDPLIVGADQADVDEEHRVDEETEGEEKDEESPETNLCLWYPILIHTRLNRRSKTPVREREEGFWSTVFFGLDVLLSSIKGHLKPKVIFKCCLLSKVDFHQISFFIKGHLP